MLHEVRRFYLMLVKMNFSITGSSRFIEINKGSCLPLNPARCNNIRTNVLAKFVSVSMVAFGSYQTQHLSHC